MQTLFRKLLFICAACALPASFASAQDSAFKITPGNVKNFLLPSFDKKSGYKEWELFGKSAEYVSDEQIFVADMRLEFFDGSESLKKTATFTSKSAEFSMPETRAKSSDTLFAEGDGFKLRGEHWLWSAKKRFVELSDNVNVEFTAKQDDGAEEMNVSSKKASLDYSAEADKFLFQDSVVVRGEDFTIKCDELETESPKSAGRSLQSLKEITASKNVSITQEKITATAQTARLVPSSGDLALEGSPMVIDVASRASVSGHKIDFTKSQSLATAHSSPDGRARAKAVILSDNEGREQATVISADKIEMRTSEFLNTFDFKGNVHLVSEEFEAFGDSIRAEARKGSGSGHAVSRITGKGSISFVKDGRTAKSDELEAYPSSGEVWLKNNAVLSDPARGMTLHADRIVMLRDDDKAVATSDQDSLVTLDIMQSENFGLSAKKDARKTRIQSRSLSMERKDREIFLSFMRDVAISSEDINAKCQFMDVYAETESMEGRSAIKKIEAFEGVVVRQKGAEARTQVAKIFPRVDVEISKTQKASHRYMQLLTSDDEPQKRPVMVLPAIENVGLGELSKDAAKQNTVIVSDRQSFVSGAEKDTYLFEGNVEVKGTDFRADCKKLEVEMKADKSGQRKITLIVLHDDVSVVQGGRSAASGRADIYPDQEMIVLTDSPLVINEDGTQARGSKIIYTKGRSSMSIENPLIRLPEMGGKNRKK